MQLNIKEEVYKCSKCGLCRSVCPLYLAEKNEMYLSRGRYIVLNNFFNNNKPLSRKFIKNLDVCLNCNKCKNFCPSGIDARDIFTKLKNEYNYKYSFLHFSTLYFLVLNIYRLIPFKKIEVKRKKSCFNTSKGKVLYFEGCYNKYINPSDKNAALNIIEMLGYKTKVCSLCCGYPYLNEGNFKKFDKNAEKFSKFSEYDYIICSCDSCYDTLKQINTINKKLLRFDEFLKLNDFKFENEIPVLYFKPLIRNDECYIPFKYELINEKGICSLMENFFILKYRSLSANIINCLNLNIPEDKTIVTTCNLSKWGLKKSLKIKKRRNKILSLAEYLSSQK